MILSHLKVDYATLSFKNIISLVFVALQILYKLQPDGPGAVT